jgi:glycosyltransferase involved in cell wall biosynthesis
MAMGVLSKQPFQVSYFRSVVFKERLEATLAGGKFDVVHVTLIRMLPYIWDRHDVPVVVDLIDSLGLNLEARRNNMRGPRHLAYEIEYQRVLDYERSATERFPATVVSSEADRQMLGGKQVAVIPNGVDLDKFPFYGLEGREAGTLIFTGNMGYGPNEEAVLWFIEEVWPRLLAKQPGLRFQIVGTNPSARVRDVARRAQSVEVLGSVPDVATCLGKASIAVCPMRSGSGIQNKVLEAIATGTPVVATTTANRGVGGENNEHLLLADSAADFASAVESLLDDAALRARLAGAGRSLVEKKFRWEEHARMLSNIYETESQAKQQADAARERSEQRINVMQMTDVTGRGGAEKALVDLALRLDRSRYNVTVCATRSAGNYQPLLDEAGVTTFVQGRKSRWDFGQWIKLVKLMRRERVDVLHTHLFGSNTLGRLLGTLAGVPVIISHEHWATSAKREVWANRLLYRLSDRTIVPSAATKSALVQSGGIPSRAMEIVYNGVDTAQFARSFSREETRAELAIPNDALLVGVVGRLSEEKGGVDLLIRAVSRLQKSEPGVRLLVVGDGPLRAGLESLASRVAEGLVTFTGTRSDVARLLHSMDVFALPSLSEALPLVVLEAMSAGLPVVATRVGGVPEIVEDGVTGLLVAPGSEDALYWALRKLVTGPNLRTQLARAGQAHVKAHFTIERMVECVEALYDSLLERKQKTQAKPSDTQQATA